MNIIASHKTLLIMLLLATIPATANSLDTDNNTKSRPAKKDTPLKTVEFFTPQPLTPFLTSPRGAEPINTHAPSQTYSSPPLGEGGRGLSLGEGGRGLSLRLDSLLAGSRTHTVTSTQRVKRKGKRRTIKVTKTVERKYDLGLYIYDITADSIVYAQNATDMMKPASTQKLYVASTFIEKKGPDFTFDTSLTTNGKIEKDSIGRPYLKGDIYLHGSFDPTLTIEDVRSMTNAIRALDVDSIDGRIIVDDHQKAIIMQEKGWQWDKTPLSEEYTFTPVTFNEGRGTNGGHVRHPELYFASTICKQLMADSIHFSSPEPWDVSMEPIKKGRKELLHLVTPCQRVLARMLKRSNNTYAESVMLNICDDDAKWSYERCRDMVRNTVRSSIRFINKHTKNDQPKHNDDNLSAYYNIVDGSGLSHSNRTTAESQVNLLRYIASDRHLFNEIYSQLPIAGVDGTISKRMAGDATRDNVRAKTGTINAVSTLTGYVTAPSGNLLAFAILVNGTYDSGFARSLQDKICHELAM